MATTITQREILRRRTLEEKTSDPLTRLCRHPILSNEETYRLIRQSRRDTCTACAKGKRRAECAKCDTIRSQGRHAFEHLGRHNAKLVVKIARRHQWSGLPIEDLVNEGFCGLTIGLRKFDPDRGLALSTYVSWWIRHAILRYISDNARLVRVPVHALELISKMRRVMRRIYALEGKEHPSPEEIRDALGMKRDAGSTKNVRMLLQQMSSRHSSLDATLATNSDGSDGLTKYLDLVPAREPTPEEALLSARREQLIPRLLDESGLKPIERIVLMRRFGIGNDEDETLKEIGDGYNLSRERIRQLQESALDKLRHRLRGVTSLDDV